MHTATTASEIIFSEQANHNFSKTLGELKRSTLSVRNRLESIRHDAAFAQRVAEAFGRPLIANERCGSWYIDPKSKGGSAYFKSTDGHTGVWKFSSRRLNLHLLDIIGKNDGCIVVDSTRRGKRMPDALSKTIPIWCSVLNRVLFPDTPESHSLYTPPQVVSQSEHAQISVLLSSFAEAFRSLKLSLDEFRTHIKKPMRPIWVTPDSSLESTSTVFEGFHPIICCTVSRRVAGGEVSEGGYIQGAGDDTENWAHGLSPPIFWNNMNTLLHADEHGIQDLIEKLVEKAKSTGLSEQAIRLVKPTTMLFVAPAESIDGQNFGTNACVINLLPKSTDQSTWQTSPTRSDVGLGPHKLGSRNLRASLPFIVGLIKQTLAQASSDEKHTELQIIVTCENGKDLSIGTALAISCLFFDDKGLLLDESKNPISIDKDFVRSRLGWFSKSMPDANPSRATLQSVNSFLMERIV
ncbi:related to 2`-O-ribosyl phosphate transferase RIT1 [Rhynchosporium agropyri]|uniref:Related to 2`-O-ribosyl phosphate transferase RIT1 n=1 Tax=Rhynchosporium agropyri TaxID=914238 RepID=A0A1E1JY70_9HELO|nr:related to 2`-O-ribosyl phosphate transferase RIT1 [Rhynchosporium agropyri]